MEKHLCTLVCPIRLNAIVTWITCSYLWSISLGCYLTSLAAQQEAFLGALEQPNKNQYSDHLSGFSGPNIFYIKPNFIMNEVTKTWFFAFVYL